MNKRTKITAALAAVMMIVLSCSLSVGGRVSEEDKIQTAVVQTITANKVEPPQQNTLLPIPTITLAPIQTQVSDPTQTQVSDPTQTPKPCNKAEFISETILDDTEFNANEAFTKTWRLKNIGTCTWNTNYELVFADGDKMSGPASEKLPQSVAPGEQIDISVDLIAPASEGTYEGLWKVADDHGQLFVNRVTVKIKVKPIPWNTYNVTLDVVMGEGGSVQSNGGMDPGDYDVGDTVGNIGVQMFAAFDISGIPSNAIIKEVKVDFTNFATKGNPFGGLGCLRLYPDPYRPLDAGDYKTPPVTGADMRWCTSAELNAVSADTDLADYMQSRLGKTYMAVRLQFNENETDGDNANDLIGFIGMSLDVKYEAP